MGSKEILTLEELVPYLPYGLKYVVNNNDILKSSGNINKAEVLGIRSLEFCLNHKIKPILRPLSDLVKGEGNYNYHDLGHWTTVNDFNLDECEYFFVRNLFKHHFDVFGLILRGLAIDINTLKLEAEQHGAHYVDGKLKFYKTK